MVPTTWIVNASPFIGLAKAGLGSLLTSPGRTLLLPYAVAQEVQAGSAQDPAIQYLRSQEAQPGFGVLPPSSVDPAVAQFYLDAGEAAVLTEALARPGCLVVMDDGKGRRAAQALCIALTGSVGVLTIARQEGQISKIAPAIKRLQAVGMFLPSKAVLQGVLQLFEENWP